MAQTGESSSQRLLKALGEGSGAERNAAFAELIAAHGTTFEPDERGGQAVLPAGGRVNEQPGSLVQQAAAELWQGLERILPQCQNDEELRRLFAGILKRRRIDRRRRAKNQQPGLESAGGDGALPTAPLSLPTRGRDSDLYRVHVEKLLEAAGGAPGAEGNTDARRALVELYVVKGLEWANIASALGVSAGTLKVRFSRMRRHLSAAVYEEVIAELPGDVGTIASKLLVDGERMADVAGTLGMSDGEIKRVVAATILPAVRDRFGPSFLGLLPRLRGRAQ